MRLEHLLSGVRASRESEKVKVKNPIALLITRQQIRDGHSNGLVDFSHASWRTVLQNRETMKPYTLYNI